MTGIDRNTHPIVLPSGYILDPHSVVVDGIDWNDCPDFCDAYILEAEATDGVELEQSDIDWLNDQSEIRYQFVASATESGRQYYD